MTRILEQGIFYTPPEPQPKPKPKQPSKVYPLPIHTRPPEAELQKERERAEKLKRLEKYSAFVSYMQIKKAQQPQPQETEVTGYEISLTPEALQELEKLASQYGLEVPEELKKTYYASPEEKEKVEAELQKKLQEFLDKLNQAAYEQAAKDSWEDFKRELYGAAEVIQSKNPTAHVFVNDAGFIVVTRPGVVRRPAPKLPPATKLPEGGLHVEQKTEPDNPYAGYDEYYRGLRVLRQALGLWPEAEQESLDLLHMPDQDRTMTWDEIQRNEKEMRTIFTLSGAISDKLGLSPSDEGGRNTVRIYESTLKALDILGSPATSIGEDINQESDKVFAEADLETPTREFLKGLPRGAIGFFTFPVDVFLLATQADKISYIAKQEGKSVTQFLKDQMKQALHSPGFYGELAGSLITGGAVSALRNAFSTRVIEVPLATEGYREASKILSTPADDVFRYNPIDDSLYRVSVELNPSDDFIRVSSSEFFDLDETYRVLIKKRPWGTKITTERTPTSFEHITYRGLLGDEAFQAKTNKLVVDMRSGNAALEVTEMLTKQTDDLLRQARLEGFINPDDVLNFVQQAKGESGSAPYLRIEKTHLLPDEMLQIRAVTDIGDDIYRVRLNVGPLNIDDVMNQVDDMTRTLSEGGSVDDILALQRAGELTESGRHPAVDVQKFFIRDRDFISLSQAAGAEARGKLTFSRPLELSIDDAVMKSIDDAAREIGGRNEKLLTLPRLEELQDTTWKVSTRVAGDITETTTRPVIMGGLKVPDLNAEVSGEAVRLLDVGLSELTIQDQLQDTRQVQVQKDETTMLVEELEREILQISTQSRELRLDVSPEISVKTKTKMKTVQSSEETLSLSLRLDYDIQQDMDELERELVTLMQLTVAEPKPRPPKRVKIKTNSKKRPVVKMKPKKQKSKKKKPRKQKEYEWAEWVGYEDLFEW